MKQFCDYVILFRFRKGTKAGSRLATFEKHCSEFFICIEKTHGRISIPEAQSVNLVPILHVWHANLHDGWASVGQSYSCNPSTTYFVIDERLTECKGPSLLKLPHGGG